MSFNTYGRKVKEYGGGKNIWYDVPRLFPVGGSIDLTGVAEGTVIPAGSMCVFNQAAGTVKVVKASDIGDGEGKTPATDINGLLFNDVYIEEATTYATGAVVYEGALYVDRLTEAIPSAVLANLPQITPIKEA